MNVQRCAVVVLFASLALVSDSAKTFALSGPAGMITGFEPSGSPSEVTNPVGYHTGSVLFQDGWTGSANLPRVQTAAEISAELTAAGLNPAGAVRSGNQALLITKVDTNTEVSGYFAQNVFQAPLTDSKVVVDYWARPLSSGLGADPNGTPAGNGKTIGERQGNTFVGIADDAVVRAAAIRFGVDTIPGNPLVVTARHIDFASASAGAAVWVRSGFSWQPDQWYNFKLNLDYDTKTYDFFINGAKVNADPIRFYNEASQAATRLFVSRGTNQAGQIIDDVNVRAVPEPTVVVLGLQVALLAIGSSLRRSSWRRRSCLN